MIWSRVKVGLPFSGSLSRFTANSISTGVSMASRMSSRRVWRIFGRGNWSYFRMFRKFTTRGPGLSRPSRIRSSLASQTEAQCQRAPSFSAWLMSRLMSVASSPPYKSTEVRLMSRA